jgi:hypothetical protein
MGNEDMNRIESFETKKETNCNNNKTNPNPTVSRVLGKQNSKKKVNEPLIIYRSTRFLNARVPGQRPLARRLAGQCGSTTFVRVGACNDL